MGEGLNVGPEDQSLWFYHQYLMLNLTDLTGRQTITPNLSLEERVAFVKREIDVVKDLWDDYDLVKWIYEALVEYTIMLIQLEGRDAEPREKEDLKSWLGKLGSLDPERKGRWNDMSREQDL